MADNTPEPPKTGFEKFQDWSKKQLPPVVPPTRGRGNVDPRDAKKPTEIKRKKR